MKRDTCPFCRSTYVAQEYLAREMMFGWLDEFHYRECGECHSIWLADPPSGEDLARFYGTGYYSFAFTQPKGVRAYLMAARDRHLLLGNSPFLGSFLARWRDDPALRVVGQQPLEPWMSVADVGCGDGWLLSRFQRAGFNDLTGIDPFAPKTRTLPNGVTIRRNRLDEINRSFDLIMFNHSLEHVTDPVADLKAARARVNAEGRVIVRLPTTTSDAWDEYGVDWFQLDAPRHFAIPSRVGFVMAASEAGFEVITAVDDSSEQQFRLSELYRAGVPLVKANLHPLGEDQLARYELRAKSANAANRGDQLIYVLRPC